MNLFEEIKANAKGAKILAKWFGDGGEPVDRAIAQRRANICQSCPSNIEANWWQRVKHAIADFIKEALVIKTKLNMDLPNDQRLQMCKDCGCCTRLKVWVPMDYIRTEVSDDKLRTYPTICWQRLETSL